VIVNGEVLHQTALSTQQVLHCDLPQRVFQSAKALTVTLLHPDGVRAASAASPLDERELSVTLHAIDLVPGTVHRALEPDFESALGRRAPPQPPKAPFDGRGANARESRQ
jgi:hypothetical protein